MEMKNCWHNLLLSFMLDNEIKTKGELVAFRDDGDFIILFKCHNLYHTFGWENKNIFRFYDSDRAFKSLTKTDNLKIINSVMWEDFKNVVILDELSK
jgi:hypothetical protein